MKKHTVWLLRGCALLALAVWLTLPSTALADKGKSEDRSGKGPEKVETSGRSSGSDKGQELPGTTSTSVAVSQPAPIAPAPVSAPAPVAVAAPMPQPPPPAPAPPDPIEPEPAVAAAQAPPAQPNVAVEPDPAGDAEATAEEAMSASDAEPIAVVTTHDEALVEDEAAGEEDAMAAESEALEAEPIELPQVGAPAAQPEVKAPAAQPEEQRRSDASAGQERPILPFRLFDVLTRERLVAAAWPITGDVVVDVALLSAAPLLCVLAGLLMLRASGVRRT